MSELAVFALLVTGYFAAVNTVYLVQLVVGWRAVRRRLKAKLADPEPGSVIELWSGLASAIREQALALEIESEHLSQLGLSRAVEGLPPSAAPGVGLAGANLRACWPFEARDRHALQALLAGAFPEAAAPAVEASLAWLEP